MYNYKRRIHITSFLRNSATNVSASHTITTHNYMTNTLITDYFDKFDNRRYKAD